MFVCICLLTVNSEKDVVLALAVRVGRLDDVLALVVHGAAAHLEHVRVVVVLLHVLDGLLDLGAALVPRDDGRRGGQYDALERGVVALAHMLIARLEHEARRRVPLVQERVVDVVLLGPVLLERAVVGQSTDGRRRLGPRRVLALDLGAYVVVVGAGKVRVRRVRRVLEQPRMLERFVDVEARRLVLEQQLAYEVLAVVGDAGERVAGKDELAALDVLGRLLVVYAAERRQATQSIHIQ